MKVWLLVICLCVLSACATQLPNLSIDEQYIPSMDDGYTASMQLIDRSKLGDQQRTLAKYLIQNYSIYKASLDSYSVALSTADAANRKRDSQYSFTNGFIGAIGGISAVKLAVGYGYLTTAWEAVGLFIQKNNVEQAINEATVNRSNLDKWMSELTQPKDLFWKAVTAPDADSANKTFEDWRVQMEAALTDVAHQLHVTPPVLTHESQKPTVARVENSGNVSSSQVEKSLSHGT